MLLLLLDSNANKTNHSLLKDKPLTSQRQTTHIFVASIVEVDSLTFQNFEADVCYDLVDEERKEPYTIKGGRVAEWLDKLSTRRTQINFSLDDRIPTVF